MTRQSKRSHAVRSRPMGGWACGGLFVLLLMPAWVLAQRQTSAAAGPWSGQAQCVVTADGPNYHDEQTHTWTLTDAAPTPPPTGSTQIYYLWPARWSIRGSGQRSWPATSQTERWTYTHDMDMLLRISDIGVMKRVQIKAEAQYGAPLGSIKIIQASGIPRDGAVQQWQYPITEDNAANTRITGSSQKTFPPNFGVGWIQPPTAITTAVCSWKFIRASRGN